MGSCGGTGSGPGPGISSWELQESQGVRKQLRWECFSGAGKPRARDDNGAVPEYPSKRNRCRDGDQGQQCRLPDNSIVVG